MFLSALVAALLGTGPTTPALRATHSTSEIHVDGRLDEAAWASADSIRDLTQVEPEEGASPSGRTIVRVLVTSDALVFGIRNEYAPATKVVAFSRVRDADLRNEDHVMLVLDTFRDGRSGYAFAVNANGARYDALVRGIGESENPDWDGVWSAATVRTATGWTVEIAIPFKTLLFKPNVTTWGLNIQRRIQARQETDRWSAPLRDARVTQTARAGLLTDLPSFNLGIGTTLRPAFVGGGGIDSGTTRFTDRSHVSFDATQRIGGNTIASVTANTDFAETEVDVRRANLSRFELFFPEKRTFFLEGADIFEFGPGANDQDMIPFFSRRVGLTDLGVVVPINAGAKVNGRAGGLNFGALGVNTRDVDRIGTAATMSVIRLTQNVLGESSIGMMATTGDPLGRAGSWLGGPDFKYRTSQFRGDQNLVVGLWALGVGREDLHGDRSAVGVQVDYPNDLWDIFGSYKRIGDAFDPSLGFVPRPGTHIVQLGANWQPRPSHPIGPLHVRQCFWENEFQLYTGLTGGWQSYEYFMAPINCRLESGDRFEFNIVPHGERFTDAFEIVPGVLIPGGTYHFQQFRLEAGFAQKRRLSAQLTSWFGTFYNGWLNRYQVTSAWKPSSLFTVELNGEQDVGHMRTGHFVQNVVGTRARLNFSPNLQLSSLIQVDDQSSSFGSNTRLRWTFSPLGDLFVVYNHNLLTRDPVTLAPRVGFESNQLQIKVQYAFRY
ncbi:MAG TPA: DUF5916 domain-containing protein [Gemmatimonadaceae bacterium]|nr:DUF5916 domain-containing protein [Gemmatimonadaceae bacterium]